MSVFSCCLLCHSLPILTFLIQQNCIPPFFVLAFPPLNQKLSAPPFPVTSEIMGILEAVYTYVDTSLCIAGILMNCFLTYCVLFKSPKSIATYSFLLLNTAMSNLTTCCITLFVEPRQADLVFYNIFHRFVVEGENFYYIANGLCKYVGKKACTAG